MPRAELDTSDSLDLFLDAISNVFGAVLFVALVVVLLLQLTSPKPPEAPPQAPPEPSETAPSVTPPVASRPDLPTPAGEGIDLLNELPGAEARINALRDELARARAQRDAREADLRDLRRQLDDARDHLQSARDELAAAEPTHAGVIRLPQFQPTPKTEIPLLVAQGRVAPLFLYNPQGQPTAVNEPAVELTPDRRHARLTPGAGDPITPDNADHLARTLTRHATPDRHYIALGVWPDSFEQAARLRNALTTLGYEYGLIPLPENTPIPLAAQSGTQ